MANGCGVTRIVLLIADTNELEDGNYLRLANECHRRGHEVALCPIESLAMSDSEIVARGWSMSGRLAPGDPFPSFEPVALREFDLVWVLSLGMRRTFLDKMQLLFSVDKHTRVINSIDTLMHFKSKYFTAGNPQVYRHPATWAANNPDELYGVMQREGGKWIVKPPASSFGRDVYLLTADDPNARVVLESLCGPEEDEYCLLQRYVSEITHGEKRVVIAGGKPVGQYLRIATKDHRTNIHQGAEVRCCDLTNEELAYCERIGAFLLTHGAEFVGVDLAFPWVIEFNVVNPGGLLTIEEVSGIDIAPAIVEHIVEARRQAPLMP